MSRDDSESCQGSSINFHRGQALFPSPVLAPFMLNAHKKSGIRRDGLKFLLDHDHVHFQSFSASNLSHK